MYDIELAIGGAGSLDPSCLPARLLRKYRYAL